MRMDRMGVVNTALEVFRRDAECLHENLDIVLYLYLLGAHVLSLFPFVV
jgi:hypothetical protein